MTSTSPRIKKPARTLLWVLLDVLLVNASLFLAQVVRYSSNISYSFFENSIRLAPAMTVIFLLVFCGFGMYRTMWQYASANDVLRIALATLVASLITYLFSLAANAFVRPQNLSGCTGWSTCCFGSFPWRWWGPPGLLYRIAVTREQLALLSTPRDDVRRVMVVGAAGPARASCMRCSAAATATARPCSWWTTTASAPARSSAACPWCVGRATFSSSPAITAWMKSSSPSPPPRAISTPH